MLGAYRPTGKDYCHKKIDLRRNYTGLEGGFGLDRDTYMSTFATADEVAMPAMGFTFGAQPVVVAEGHEPVVEAVVVGEPFVPVEGSAPAFTVEAVEVIATPAVTAQIIYHTQATSPVYSLACMVCR